MKTRERNYDLLRVISAYMVILGHVSGTFLETFIWDFYDGLPGNHPLYTCLYTAVCRFSVPVFLMLSGAFVLANDKTADAGAFYRKAGKQIGLPALAAIVFAFAYSAITGLFIDHAGIMPALTALLNGAPFYHLWYLPVMLGIYLMAPWICRFRMESGKTVFRNTSAALLAAGTLALWLNAPVVMHWNIGEAVCYAGYFMCGYVIRDSAKKNRSGIFLVLCGVLLEIGAGILLYRLLLTGADRTLAEHRCILSYTPLTAAASVLIFAGCACTEIKTDTSKLAGAAYGIYLTHAFILDVIVRISRAWMGQRWLTHMDARIAVPLLSLLLYFLSFFVTKGIQAVRRR